jgi:superoxide dismutase, Fe-Mn family
MPHVGRLAQSIYSRRRRGGSGWVVLGYNRKLKLLENYWMADHASAPADTSPVLVMDMYEHAYQMDYGAAAAK